MIKVKVHTILGLKKIIGQRELELSIPEESNVGDLLSHMVKSWGKELSSYLFEPGGNHLFSHIRLMVNGRDIGFLNGMDTVLGDRDEISILPPVSGG